MVNVNKLRGKIVEQGLNVEKLAVTLDIDASTLYRKIANNGEGFTIAEADAIVKALDLSGSEAAAIFFSQFVA